MFLLKCFPDLFPAGGFDIDFDGLVIAFIGAIVAGAGVMVLLIACVVAAVKINKNHLPLRTQKAFSFIKASLIPIVLGLAGPLFGLGLDLDRPVRKFLDDMFVAYIALVLLLFFIYLYNENKKRRQVSSRTPSSEDPSHAQQDLS